MAVLGASLIISYERAKAEALGFNAKGGVMERAERVILLGMGLLFPVLLIPVLWVMLVLTIVTAVQRFAKVWRQASQERPVVAPTRRASRRRAARATRAGSSQWRQNLQARRRR
jgi:CDP-diacylglycerol--glycerol-3-phosphate 3-phosphatidyltransferase